MTAAVDVVRGFLRDVRSGIRVRLAADYLAPVVEAHQGRPGTAGDVVLRTPDGYAAHVEQMLRAYGPWSFDVLALEEEADGLVRAQWLQRGGLNTYGPDHRRPVRELGTAHYRVRRGRICAYWIDVDVVVEPLDP